MKLIKPFGQFKAGREMELGTWAGNKSSYIVELTVSAKVELKLRGLYF